MSRSVDPVSLGGIELFCKAAESASFTAAATQLGVTPAAISRSVARLEARLGVRLFVRTTRHLRLTEVGRSYFEQCRSALAQIAEAGRNASGQQAVASGVLRISVPTTYAHYRLLPLLPQFAQSYPLVQIEVSVSNRNIDFVEEGFDLAIRAGTPSDSSLVARKLEDASLGVFAAPDYLRRHGTPQVLADLKTQHWIGFELPSTGRAMHAAFRDQGRDVDYPLAGQVRMQDDVLACLSYARAGGGLCQLFHFVAAEALRRGELVEVLQPYSGRSRSFTLLYPHKQHLPVRIRALVDFLTTAQAST